MALFDTKLNFPDCEFRLSSKNGKNYIFDMLRKKELILTPEEWVRQHLVRYLIEHKAYPAGLTQLEKKVNVNGLSRRFDLAVSRTDGTYFLLAECKAPHIELTAETVYQTAAYGKVLSPSIYLITNGLRHICFTVSESGIQFLQNIPDYEKATEIK